MKIPFYFISIQLVVYLMGADLFAADVDGIQKQAPYTIGTEVDVLPYVTGGYYFSLVGGYEHFRLRGVTTLIYPPSFSYPSDRFSNLKLRVYAIIVDYFLRPEPDGFWFGAGLEKWIGTIDSDNGSLSGGFHESVATLGTGYVWKFYRNFYLNPWLAVHYKISGDSPEVGSDTYQLPTFQGEGSLKIGWYF